MAGSATTDRRPGDPVVDGGDRACGELLLVLAARVRQLEAGTVIWLIATDPAAAIDLPAWCHLTGHQFVATTRTHDDRPLLRGTPGRTLPPNPARSAVAARRG